MRFTLQPTVRQLTLAFPILLTALPAAMSADADQPALVLPPASLYDATRPGQPTLLAPAPSVSTPAVETPPPAAKAAEPTKPAATVEAKPAAAAAAQATSTAPEPWYRRWFSWLPWNSSKKPTAQPASAQQPVVVVQQDAAAPATESLARGQYAYDASNRSIRAGTTGECVKMGVWSPETAAAGCHPTVVASNPVPDNAAPTVAMTQPPKAAPAGPAPTVVAMNQPPKQGPAGSAPAPIALPQPRLEPVHVVPLPPRPPAAKEERPLEPVDAKSMSHDETIAALADTPLMSEPELDKLTFSAGALFPLGSNKIKPAGQEKLDEMVEQLRGMRYDKVIVVGHTDPTGSKPMNDKLSKRRAEAVKAYLVAKGVDRRRIQTEGKGGSEPLPKTQDCDALPRMDKIVCYAPDRRVEVEVVGGKSQGSASASARIPDLPRV